MDGVGDPTLSGAPDNFANMMLDLAIGSVGIDNFTRLWHTGSLAIFAAASVDSVSLPHSDDPWLHGAQLLSTGMRHQGRLEVAADNTLRIGHSNHLVHAKDSSPLRGMRFARPDKDQPYTPTGVYLPTDKGKIALRELSNPFDSTLEEAAIVNAELRSMHQAAGFLATASGVARSQYGRRMRVYTSVYKMVEG